MVVCGREVESVETLVRNDKRLQCEGDSQSQWIFRTLGLSKTFGSRLL